MWNTNEVHVKCISSPRSLPFPSLILSPVFSFFSPFLHIKYMCMYLYTYECTCNTVSNTQIPKFLVPLKSLVTFQISVCASKDTHNTVYVYISLKLETQQTDVVSFVKCQFSLLLLCPQITYNQDSKNLFVEHNFLNLSTQKKVKTCMLHTHTHMMIY